MKLTSNLTIVGCKECDFKFAVLIVLFQIVFTKSVYIVTLEEEIISVFKRWAFLISAKLETLATSCSAHYDVQIKTIWLFVVFSNLEQQNALGGGEI